MADKAAMAEGAANPTAERVLVATEALCAERGLESVSIRDIAKKAGVSVSVIYHHYGSKIDLLKAVIYRRMGELFFTQSRMFEELEELPNPPLDKVLYAIIAPLSLLRKKGSSGEVTGLFLARVLLSTVPEIKDEIDEGAGRTGRLIDIVQRAAPHLSRKEVCWRLHFTIGIAHMTAWDYQRLELMSGGLVSAESVDEAIDRAVNYAKSAFQAPEG